MTDEALRALERRFLETRAVADEAALLRERVRAGLITAERLAIAVHAGHAAALNFRRQIGYIGHVFTHEEYDRWNDSSRDREIKERARLVREHELRKRTGDGFEKEWSP